MSELLLDAAGRRRSPATMPGSMPVVRHGTKGCATPPTHPPWRRSSRSCAPPATLLTAAGCATKRSRSARPISTTAAARSLFGAARAVAAARSAWTNGLGRAAAVDRGPARPAGRPALLCDQRPDPWAAMVECRRACRSPPDRRAGRCSPALRAASAAPRPRGRDGARGRPADRHPASARSQQPRYHLDLPPRHRQRGDHRHRPFPASAHGSRKRLAAALTTPRGRRSSRIAIVPQAAAADLSVNSLLSAHAQTPPIRQPAGRRLGTRPARSRRTDRSSEGPHARAAPSAEPDRRWPRRS